MGEKVPLIARAVGGRVLGPRPGKAIVTFWQGIVEIFLRVVVACLSLAALIPAGVALSTHTNASDTREQEKIGASALVVGVATVALVVELGFILLRFVNVGIVNYKIKWFLITDAVLAFSLGLLFLGSTAAAGYASHQWKKESHTVYAGLAAASAFSCLGMVVLGLLCIWSLLFLLNKWNKHVVVYTLKDAVLG